MDSYSDDWLSEFRKTIIKYNENRAPDPFMIWFKDQDSSGLFADAFERVLVVLINSRFDQRTKAESALKNTVTVVKCGALKKILSGEDVPLLLARQMVTAEQWTNLFCSSLPKMHGLARRIVEKREWDAEDLLNFMLHRFKVSYLGVKTSRLAVRWMHELVSDLEIDMANFRIPIDSLVYRVSSRLGIIDPRIDKYYGENSPADLKIQSFVKRIAPEEPYILDEPLWSTGRMKRDGGHCFPTGPECKGCIFENVCQKKFLDVEPETLGMLASKTSVKRKRTPTVEEKRVADRQMKFAEFVEELKRHGVTGKEYRERVMQWQNEHKN